MSSSGVVCGVTSVLNRHKGEETQASTAVKWKNLSILSKGKKLIAIRNCKIFLMLPYTSETRILKILKLANGKSYLPKAIISVLGYPKMQRQNSYSSCQGIKKWQIRL